MAEGEHQETLLEKMLDISALMEQKITNENEEVGTISYYKDFVFQGSSLAEKDLFVASLENTIENTNTYEIYSGKTNNLIATVNEQGKIHFMPNYIESLKQINPRLVKMLNLEGLKFKLPQELQRDDIVLTKEERESIIERKRESRSLLEDDISQNKDNEEQLDEEISTQSKEEEQQQKVMKAKNIPSHSIFIVKENSNLYKDHPNLEPNLYFYRDNQGVVRAEYIDNNGDPQPSKYFEPSTTSLRQETVSLGSNGNPVTKNVPYQVMKTNGLNNIDKDVRDVRMTINIDSYGYLEISETRQGKNGQWLSHEIEIKGRDYNSYEVNNATSIYNRNADPDKQIEAYEKAEDSKLAQDDIQYSEMYLIEHADEIIDELIKEGYQKKEAVKIFDYMIGEEKLALKEAKEKVEKEIKKTQERDLEKEPEERTPWGDAEARSKRARI